MKNASSLTAHKQDDVRILYIVRSVQVLYILYRYIRLMVFYETGMHEIA